MYLVTEGSHFLSSHIIVQLLKAGHRVRTTVSQLNKTNESELLSLCQEAKGSLEVVEANLETVTSLQNCLEGVNGVFLNTPSVSPCTLSSADEPRLVNDHVTTVLNLLTACQQAGCVTRVVFTSSVSAITRGHETKNSETKLSEADWSNVSDDLTGTYARVSTAREKACWDYINRFEGKPPFDLIAMNPGLLVGPVLASCNHIEQNIIASYLKGEKVTARISFSLVDVRDAAAAHVSAMTSSKIQSGRYLLHGKTLWLNDVVELLKKNFQPLGYKISPYKIPNGLFKFAGFFCKDAKIVGDMLDKTFDLDNAKMIDELGVSPHSIEDAIIEMGHSLVRHHIVPTTELYRSRLQ